MIYTDNYQFNKPQIGVDDANINTENQNWDKADTILFGAQTSLAAGYDATRGAADPYNTGDVVMYDFVMYRCLEDGVYGAWNPTKWERTTAVQEGGANEDFTGATSQAAGTHGLVPAPAAGEEDKFLKGDGSWGTPPGKNYDGMIAEIYDDTADYIRGDIVIYNNALYLLTTDTATGAWEPTKWTQITIGDMIEGLSYHLENNLDIATVADLARTGKLLRFMDYGDQLVLDWKNDTTEYEMPMNLCAVEMVKDENDNDIRVADFESNYVLPIDTVYDAPEAIIADTEDIPAGDYYFKIVNDSWGGNNGKFVRFTLAAALTAGQQIRKKSGAYNAAIEDCTLGIFASGSDTTGTVLSFTVSTTEPTTGTNLGQTDGTGYCNFWHCVALGYNRWKYSAIRQYLNSEGNKNTWWTQQHKWDVMPAYATTRDGFLKGYDPAILASIKTTKIVTVRNTVFNSGDTPLGGEDVTYDRVFLASLEQMYIQPQASGEGSYWPYYKGLLGTSEPVARSQTYPVLIKYDMASHATARYRWLRSAYRGNANYVWIVYTSGTVSNFNANSGFRSAPCLRIG